MASPNVEEPPSGDSDDPGEYVFVKAYRNKKSGKLMVAAHYGYEAWRFRVKSKNNQT